MRHAGRAAVVAALAGSVLAWGPAGRATVTVLGGGMAEACYHAAKIAATQNTRRQEQIEECTEAIEQGALDRHDLAGTYVNRGVLYLASGKYAISIRDFDAAAKLWPDLGEALVNRGAALIGLGRDQDGIAEIDRGLSFNPEAPEKAYFNRALAKERLDDLKGAYFDYLKASQLKPDWEMPKKELARFHVETR